MKQGEAMLIHRLIEQGVGQMQGLFIVPILAVPQWAPALRITQEVLQCPHIPGLAGCEQGIAELDLRVSCERRTRGEV